MVCVLCLLRARCRRCCAVLRGTARCCAVLYGVVRWVLSNVRQFDTLVQWQLRDMLGCMLHGATLLVIARVIGREPELDLRAS